MTWPIVWHNEIFWAFFLSITNQGDVSPDTLNISNLGHEGAVSAVKQNYRKLQRYFIMKESILCFPIKHFFSERITTVFIDNRNENLTKLKVVHEQIRKIK